MKTSYLELAVNILLTMYLGIQMPNSSLSKWIFCTCFDRPRAATEPPFFFQEVRLGMLMVSILFNLGRLIYEATAKDISVILIAARLCLTTLQLVDQWWFCKNWEFFFVQKKMRAYIWFRLFVVVCMFSMLYCLLETFPPYTNDSRLVRLEIDAFQWAAGLQVILWYLWGKRWSFKWGDMNDERRIPAIVGAMFTSSLIYGLGVVYLLINTKLSNTQFGLTSAITAAITATVAYFLGGVAFRYLDIVTNRSTQARTRILNELIDASATDGHSHGSLPLAERRRDDDADPMSGENVEENHRIENINEDEENGHLDISHIISSNKSIASNTIHDVCGGGIDVDRVRVKPNNLHTSSKSNVLESSELVIDHVNIPLTIQNSLEINVVTYETAHLLSDKIVVVFVQVITPT